MPNNRPYYDCNSHGIVSTSEAVFVSNPTGLLTDNSIQV